MSCITVAFLGNEFSIPRDILTYIDLLGFTHSVQKSLVGAFVRKLKNEIQNGNVGILSDDDLTAEIQHEVGRFIAKLCDNGIFTRTVNDYLNSNKGYQAYSAVNKAALEKMKALLIQEMDSWQAGYENAMQKKESHVTGMGFSIWSSSFAHHAIYAAMQASTISKQEKEAATQYERDMSSLHSYLDSKYGGEKSKYINNVYIPNMEAALTAFTYELLDKYLTDLIANGQFDKKTLEYVDIGRSNDLLKNLNLSTNKLQVLVSAFTQCPFNSAVYMHALEYDLLDCESFHTAKLFGHDTEIIRILQSKMGGEKNNHWKLNYDNVEKLARYTGEPLRNITLKVATSIVDSYAQIVELIRNPIRCASIIGRIDDNTILTGEQVSRRETEKILTPLMHISAWDKLTQEYGHDDLLARLINLLPNPAVLSSKHEYDDYLKAHLFTALESCRIEKCKTIHSKRQEEERKREKEIELIQVATKRKKRQRNIFLCAIVCCIVFSCIVVLFVVPTMKYNTAVGLMQSGKYAEAIEVFSEIEKHKDSTDQIALCQNAILDDKYDEAVALMKAGKYAEAIEIFSEIGKHKDSAAQITLCQDAILNNKYDEAVALMNAGKYNEAIAAFTEIKTYKDSMEQINVCENAILDGKYDAAVALMTEEKYKDAYDSFVSLDGYKDSTEQALRAYQKYNLPELEKASVGSYVTFGAYEQDANTRNGKEDIEWLVLDKQDDRILVISKYGLNCVPYNEKRDDVTWEACTLRKWLNEDFLNAAFNDTEQAMIPTVTVTADKNPYYNTNPGNATQDKVFLLSILEANKYFASDSARACKPTAYAKMSGARNTNANGFCFWWMRSPGADGRIATLVGREGGISGKGTYVDDVVDGIVRPAMWIDLK